MTRRFNHEWLLLSSDAVRVVARAIFPNDSAWFSGHFPGNPIVPGVALIALVEEAVIAQARSEGRSLAITGLRRVRFRLPIRPDDEVTLEAIRMPKKEGPAYVFNVYLAGESACSGVLTAEAPRS
jgi:3-hydroxymyristoyl/3-hydroxydecanoyl-(acyl carrier protein) dehydratase